MLSSIATRFKKKKTKPIDHFQGHTEGVTSVAISPNGKHALTGSFDFTAKLWNVNNGKVKHTFQGHTHFVTSVAFSPNGKYALTGSWDDTAILWKVNDKTVVHEFQGHTDFVNSVAFSPDGQYVLTGSLDGTAKLWNIRDGKVVYTFQGHGNLVVSVAFSPNGQYVLIGSDEKTVKLLNYYDGTVVHTFQGHTDSVHSVVFSLSGHYALTGSDDKTAKLWNVHDGKVVHTFQGHTDDVNSVAFSPNGQYVLTGSADNTAKLWNIHDGTVVHTFQGHTDSVNSVVFSLSGHYALTGSSDGTVKFWQLPESVVACKIHPEGVTPLSTSNVVTNNLQTNNLQTSQTFMSYSDPSNSLISNGTNVLPTPDSLTNLIATKSSTSSPPTSTTTATKPFLDFQGHTHYVSSVAVSPNGQYILTGSFDSTAKLWNVNDGTVAHAFEGHADPVWSVAFSPDGQNALTGSADNTAKLWNIHDGTVVHTFLAHTDDVTSVAFSPNRQHVLTGSFDNTAKLWNVNNGTVAHTFQGHADSVNSVAFSPTGQNALTGSDDNTAILWNVHNRTNYLIFQGHTKPVESLAFSPDGQYVLTGSEDKTAKLWNINDGTIVRVFQGHTGDVSSVAFSPNGQYVLTGSCDKTAKLWNIHDGIVVRTFQGHARFVLSVAFSPDGQYALTGSWDNTAKTWQLPESVAASKNHPENVIALSTSNDATNPHQTSQKITSHSIFSGPSSSNDINLIPTPGSVLNTIETKLLLSLSSSSSLTTTTKPMIDCQGHTNCVSSVAISLNGQYALTGSFDNTAKLWNVNNGTVAHTFQGHADSVRSVAFSPTGQNALTGSEDGTAKLWNVNNGTVVNTFQGHGGSVWSVAFSPNGQYILTGSGDNAVKLWNISKGTIVHTFQGHTGDVSSVAFSPNGQHVLTGSYDKTAKLWNVNDGTVVHTFHGHKNWVWSVAFSPNGQYVLTGSWDNTVKLWNVNYGNVVHTFRGHTDDVNSVAFSPNGQYILTGSFDKTAKLWNVKDGTVMHTVAHTFQEHTYSVNSVAFSSNGKYVLTGSDDKTAKLWELPESLVASTFPSENISLSSTSNVVTNPQQTNQTLTLHSDSTNPSPLKDVSSTEGQIKHLKSMGFAETRARTALDSCDLNLERAIEFLLDHVSIDSSPLSTSNVVTNPQQFTLDSDPFSPSFSNDVNVIPTTDSVPNTTVTNNMSLQAYDSVNVALLNKLHEQGDRFLNIINNAFTMESGMYDLLSQYPKELQSLLYEKSQSELEKKELNAIMRSREHCQFYTHFIRKLKGMMTACETINSGMVSQADISFQDYVHGLVKEGAWTALQQIDLGKVLGGAIQWAKKQFASVPFTDAIGSFFKMACEYKTKRDQHLAIGRVAIMSALADMHEHDRGGVNGTVHRIGRCIVRAEARYLSLLESEEFGCMKELWAKATGGSADTPAKERGCIVADLVIGVIMNPTKNTDLYNILEGHTINQSASLGEIIVAAALDVSIEDVQKLDFFVSEEDNIDVSNKSSANAPAEQYLDKAELFNTVEMGVTEINIPNHPTFNNASGVATIEEVQRIKKAMLELQNRNDSMRRKYDDVQMKYENVTRQVTKLKNEKKGTEVDVGGGLAQAYVNPYGTSGQETSVTKRVDRLERTLVAMETNQLETNKIIVEHEERWDLVDNNKKMAGVPEKKQHDNCFSREVAIEKRKREKEEERKRIERERRELFD